MNLFDYLLDDNRNSEKLFLLGNSEKISFSELYDNSVRLSQWLKDQIGENKNVLIASHNSEYFITVYLGILKSGNICVPINPVTEQSNLDYIVEAADISIAFLSSKLKLEFGKYDIPYYSEADLLNILHQSAFINNPKTITFDENRMAEILFTSGSTGHPKGVMLSHKNVIANTQSIIEYLKLTSSEIMLVVLPFYYCYGLSLLHTHLKIGGSIVLNNSFVFLGTVLNDLNRFKCTGFAGVPSHFQILLRKSKSFIKSEFPYLKYVTQAGGKLHNIFIKEFVDYFPHIKFFVMYGQTEATARLSYLPTELILDKIGSVGKGIPGVTLDVLNQNNETVLEGETGEVVAKGNNIMIGYLNDDSSNKLTLKDGWLRTGDMAKKDSDGFIYLVARKKEIIKVAGKRVSLKEIEEVIVSIPFVLSCKIKGIYDNVLGEAIKAIVFINEGIDYNDAKEAVIKECRSKLALYKVPSIIEFENKLTNPLNYK